MRTKPVVAIDGPAGAGKTAVTRLVAEQLGYLLVDTGALYRAVALAASRRGISWDDAAGLGALSTELAERKSIRFEAHAEEQRVLLDGEDVSSAIRTEAMSQGASKVSAIPEVRQALLELQRTAGADGGVVLEGRDIGTVVFPDAEAKFYLTASSEVRAQRRYDQLIARGTEADFQRVHEDVIERDRRDSSRPVAPLRQAPDAQLVDSSELGIDEVVERIVARVRAIEQRFRS